MAGPAHGTRGSMEVLPLKMLLCVRVCKGHKRWPTSDSKGSGVISRGATKGIIN